MRKTKFLLILKPCEFSPYANCEVVWDYLRGLCRPDLLKWELKLHFKGLLSHTLSVCRLTAHMWATCVFGKGWCDSRKHVSTDGEMPLSLCLWFQWLCLLTATSSHLYAYLRNYFFPKGKKKTSISKLFSYFLWKYKWVSSSTWNATFLGISLHSWQR